ncbi:hypothetical protein COX85_00345 [Candidatus Micrarchaeota archaeon CG_4_10_14_0_2_um_filter_55_9]|nr:MAG: hypothetical protein AUJ15_01445 [Candidatus Micrarchaeota archaeon CG1_02_55_41]PIO03608.1 MAG: hypothetical protein COT57_00480 [Candidatus Micrarchaeota archaeon CG09_land_8_20_14_0_10_55_25]PIZ92101.1 MAG: hypothetical protein COX85_00345 [Candidatus Micrarchaeota archaeon CG_4_10_14_0_2_um_filter_55_9]PJD01352.1 MAG: hypothetical protein COU38_01445 [Candidatus Micrarchaeota archaeon CG10_big_fil_rev_8_21_14_0_10_54_18]
MKRKLYTLGYEGRDLPSFIQQLKDEKVEKLLDVRQTAWSRKRGFSKTALSEAVESEGITYLHFSMVGAPKALREELYSTWDYARFFAGYRKHLNKLNGDLTEVVEEATSGSACLMCFEADHKACHRSVLAQCIKRQDGNGLQIIHL